MNEAGDKVFRNESKGDLLSAVATVEAALARLQAENERLTEALTISCKRNVRLRELVQYAYEEGWDDALYWAGVLIKPASSDEDWWHSSFAKKALEGDDERE